jgi:hypothetical protein
MKNIIIILLLLFTFKGFSQEDEKSKKIKSLGYKVEKEYAYLTKFGEIDRSTEFMIKRIEYNNKGKRKKTENYFRGDDSNEYGYVRTSKYNEKGEVIKSVNYNAKGDIRSIIKYEHRDSLMRVIRIYSKDGDLERKVDFDYNIQNERIRSITYDSIGKLDSKTTYEYNSNNQLTRENSFDRESKLKTYILYKNTDSTEVYKEYNDKDEVVLEISKKLNPKKQVINELYSGFYRTTKTIYEYDFYGLEIKTTVLGENGEPIEFRIIERN